ncbi:MAG TPA: hypothetical protein VH813_06970 [Candidatus Limnocylindrales bacterium]|jgi:hypothetical protein
MSASDTRSTRDGATAIGVILIVVGVIGYAIVQAGLDPGDWLGGSGWTLFVIGAGVALLGAALLTERASALGFTIAGAIVTTVGLLLLSMDRAGHWETWAYAWSLIPAAAGVALVAHGVRIGASPVMATGARLIGIGALLFVAGWWFFETVFQTGRVPFDLGSAWPLVLVAVGGLVALLGVLSGREGHPRAQG